MTKDDKIGVEVDKAVRGQILDRDNNKLAYDGKAYQVNIHPSVFTANKDENLPKFAEVLDVSMDKISEKIENQNTRKIELNSGRGTIYDRNKM